MIEGSTATVEFTSSAGISFYVFNSGGFANFINDNPSEAIFSEDSSNLTFNFLVASGLSDDYYFVWDNSNSGRLLTVNMSFSLSLVTFNTTGWLQVCDRSYNPSCTMNIERGSNEVVVISSGNLLPNTILEGTFQVYPRSLYWQIFIPTWCVFGGISILITFVLYCHYKTEESLVETTPFVTNGVTRKYNSNPFE